MRRSALTDGTTPPPGDDEADPPRGRAERRPRNPAGGALPSLSRMKMALLMPAMLLAFAGIASASSVASSPRWTTADDFPGFRKDPDEGPPMDGPTYDSDVTPEERMIDQLNALLQRTQGRHKSRQQQQQEEILRLAQGRSQGSDGEEEVEDEEEGNDEAALEDVLEEAWLMPPPSPAREGRGPGFTFRFPEPLVKGEADEEQGRYFAVNPSDPKYYTASAIGRTGGGSTPGRSWEATGEGRESEGGGPLERPRPIGRFPVVKPIKVVSTSGTEIPPINSSEEDDTNDLAAAGTVVKGNGEGEKVDKAKLQVSHESPVNQGGKDEEHLIGIPAEQVKRERPDKVPLDFGSDAYLTAIISGCIAAVVVGVLAFAIFWYRLQRNAKAAADVEYPAYGVTGPNQEASAVAAAAAAAAATSVSPTPHSGGSTSPLSAGDRRLAQSAQMYHYQHQKQQIIAMESRASNERRGSVSEVDSEEENEEGDYTVYECPGLAPTGEMEVKNPLFHDDPTPATPSAGNNGRDQRGGDGGGKP